ncbi:ATPase [Palleronia sp.]|uniref:ATPase n=1 Tax=Palleronia sp. TaxID=1940284 RepID=UPI0035C79C1F
MTMRGKMTVALRLPDRTLFEGDARKLNAVASNGAFGVLPNHVDFVTALVPSVLLIVDAEGTERVFGIDEGLLVKTGHKVDIGVWRGVESRDLESLRKTARSYFDVSEDSERVARTAMSRLEATMVRRFAEVLRPEHV